MRKMLVAFIFLCTACTLNFEETYIDGKDNKVEEESKSQTDPHFKVNAKIPIIE